MAEVAQTTIDSSTHQDPPQPIKTSVDVKVVPDPSLNVPAVPPAQTTCHCHLIGGAAPLAPSAPPAPIPPTSKTAISINAVPAAAPAVLAQPSPVAVPTHQFYQCPSFAQPIPAQPLPMAPMQHVCPCMMMMMSMMNHQMYSNPYYMMNQQSYGHQMGYPPPGYRPVRPPWF